MVYEAETLKRIEEAFDVINDYTIDLYYLSIQDKVKHYVDFVACWECLYDLKCAYRETVEKMKTTIWTINGLFGLIGEIFDELSHDEEAWLVCGCGESKRETIDDAISTYKREVDKMNKKVENLKAKLQQLYVDVDKDMMIEK